MTNKKVSSRILSAKFALIIPLMFTAISFVCASDGEKVCTQSTFADNPPLVLVNGVIYTEKLDNLNPNTIKEISVWKDEIALTKYGTQGQNGVISIILKDEQQNAINNPDYRIRQGASQQSRQAASVPVCTNGVDPLYIVNGVTIENAKDLPQASNIESLTVLKNQPATALYGEKGKNGVVIVTTKRGDSTSN
jgi:TonB-dependent SusC/RagA subfamily outer membrane receptor